MKTLDEVIKVFEQRCCQGCDKCPYYPDDCLSYLDEPLNDALHYLKELRDRKETLRNWTEKAISVQQNLSDTIAFMRAYRDDKDDLTALRAYWKEQQANPALTWDELRQMEGKPVWVEQHHGDTKGWLLILRKCDDVVTCTTKHGNSFYLYKANYGEKWQAYRKERNETN